MHLSVAYKPAGLYILNFYSQREEDGKLRAGSHLQSAVLQRNESAAAKKHRAPRGSRALVVGGTLSSRGSFTEQSFRVSQSQSDLAKVQQAS